jgi:hypothetical protein
VKATPQVFDMPNLHLCPASQVIPEQLKLLPSDKGAARKSRCDIGHK